MQDKKTGEKKKQKLAFVSDFDGTITDTDFFDYTAKAYFTSDALNPWQAYLSGKKTHFDALKEMYAMIRSPKEDFLKLIHKLKIDPYLDQTLTLCQNKNIPISICSAGNDYYIRELLSKEIEKFHIDLITNTATYSETTGLQMLRPEKNLFYYDEEVGISKVKIVESFQKRGYSVIYAGDGPPDFESAKKADVVFAKKILLKKCQDCHIKTEKFESFLDIYHYILGLS